MLWDSTQMSACTSQAHREQGEEQTLPRTGEMVSGESQQFLQASVVCTSFAELQYFEKIFFLVSYTI